MMETSMSDERSASVEQPAEAETGKIETAAPGIPDTSDDLQAALAEAQQQASQNRDSYLRAAAELDNLRKRTQRDVEHAHKFALERFLSELLPVKDSLEMGLAAAEKAKPTALRQGMELTLKLLATVLERFGVDELNPVKGEAFDPGLHEAMVMQETADTVPGTVLLTVQKGYLLRGRLLRPARVIVAKSPAGAA